MVLGFLSCSNPLSTTLDILFDASNRPEADCDWRYGHAIALDTVITVNFSKDMDASTLVLGGTMESEATAVWTSKRTLELSSDAGWSDHDEHTITVQCADSEGLFCQFDRIFGTVDGVLYVSPEGATWGSGRRDDPLDTINDAISMAWDVYPGVPGIEIRVAEGVYENFAASGTAVQVMDGQQLLGGWSLDFTARDPSLYTSVIDGQWDDEGTFNAALVIKDCGIATLVDGFSIIGIRETYGDSTVLYLESSSATIRNNRLYAYHGTVLEAFDFSGSIEGNDLVSWADSSIDLFVTGGSSSIYGNNITSNSMSWKTTVWLTATDLVFDSNSINLKTGDVGVEHIAVYIAHGNPVIRNNVIDAGIAGENVAIENASASPDIVNNTILCGSGSIAIHGSGSRTIAIRNYSIFGSSTFPSNPRVINNLLIATGENDPNHLLFEDLTPGSGAIECSDNSYEGFAQGLPSAADGNFDTPGLLNTLDLQTWELTASSPAEVQTGGQDLSVEFQSDMNGSTRPAGAWSRGAFQWL